MMKYTSMSWIKLITIVEVREAIKWFFYWCTNIYCTLPSRHLWYSVCEWSLPWSLV